MPIWAILALATGLTWAVVNLLDKLVIEQYVQNPVTIIIIDSIISGSIALVVLLTLASSIPLGLPAAAALLSGLTMTAYSISYFRALQQMDASVVAILVQAAPLLSVIVGMVLFSEHLNLRGCLGISLILGGVLPMVVEPYGKSLSKQLKTPVATQKSASLLILGFGVLMLTSSNVLQKISVQALDPLIAFLLGRIGGLLVLPVLLLNSGARSNLSRLFSREPHKPRPPGRFVLLSSILLNMLAGYLLINALKAGPFTYVIPIASTQPLFVVLLIIPMRLLWRGFPDQGTKENLAGRLLSATAVVLGIYFLS